MSDIELTEEAVSSKMGETTKVEEKEESQYVTGVKLGVIVASVALACFLMLVDTMVISTVG